MYILNVSVRKNARYYDDPDLNLTYNLGVFSTEEKAKEALIKIEKRISEAYSNEDNFELHALSIAHAHAVFSVSCRNRMLPLDFDWESAMIRITIEKNDVDVIDFEALKTVIDNGDKEANKDEQRA